MDEVQREFEEYVAELRMRMRAGELTGADGERAVDNADRLIGDYRSKLPVERAPSRRRDLLERFKTEAGRL